MKTPYVTTSERRVDLGEKQVRYHIVLDRVTIDLDEGEAERLVDQLSSALELADVEF